MSNSLRVVVSSQDWNALQAHKKVRSRVRSYFTVGFTNYLNPVLKVQHGFKCVLQTGKTGWNWFSDSDRSWSGQYECKHPDCGIVYRLAIPSTQTENTTVEIKWYGAAEHSSVVFRKQIRGSDRDLLKSKIAEEGLMNTMSHQIVDHAATKGKGELTSTKTV